MRKRNKIYTCWSNMIRRCNPKYKENNPNYAGKGITVCDAWKNDFKSFYAWAIDSGYKDGLTIDRIDNNGNYCPENCRWATLEQQANNRHTNRICEFKGFTGTLKEVCKHFSLNYEFINNRIQKGYSIKDAFSMPKFNGPKRKMVEYNGESMSLSQWAKRLGITGKNTLYERLKQGWSISQAFETPVRKRG